MAVKFEEVFDPNRKIPLYEDRKIRMTPEEWDQHVEAMKMVVESYNNNPDSVGAIQQIRNLVPVNDDNGEIVFDYYLEEETPESRKRYYDMMKQTAKSNGIDLTFTGDVND